MTSSGWWLVMLAAGGPMAGSTGSSPAAASTTQPAAETDAKWPVHMLPIDETETRSVMLAIGFAGLFVGGGMTAAPIAFYGAGFVEAPTSLVTTWPGWVSLAGLAAMSVGAAVLLALVWVELAFPWLSGWKRAFDSSGQPAEG